MDIFEKLGNVVSKSLRAIPESIIGVAGWRVEKLHEVDRELAAASVKEEMFRTEEFKKLVKPLKEKLKHSPMDIPDWLDTVLSIPSGLLIEPAFSMMSGISTDEIPDEAKTVFKGFALLVDYAVLAGILDNVATAMSGTLLRKVGDFADRIIAASGVSQMMAYGMGSAVGPAVAPRLVYAINKQIEPFRFDPEAIITAWRRDEATYEKLFDDLKDQGWSDDRIKALKFLTEYYPSPAEAIHWTAREAFEDDAAEKYGLDAEFDRLDLSFFDKLGVKPFVLKYNWRAHWEHASYMQIREMLRRGVLSEDKSMPEPPTTEEGWETRDKEGIKAAESWYRLVEIPPFWRARLTEMMFEIPTRVDVRRWWDMRTISEERLRSIYHSQGYHGKDLDDYVLWTKVYVAFPDLVARWKNGWITEDDVRNELTGLGMPSERVEEMIQTKIKPAKPERVTNERDLTKTDIYRGVKKGVISETEGIELLQDLGYDEAEARYIIQINVGAIEGSPETYAEFKQWTQLYRKAQGLEAKVLPPEVIEAGKAVAEAKVELGKAEEKGLKNEKLAPYLKAMSDTEYRYRQLLIKWEAE